MPIFDNCLIQAPDGVNLSRCGMKKLRWYLNRGMAEMVAENPPTIRLKFEPSGRNGLDDPLLLDGKPNICVVCGTTEDLTRHHIIPYSFIRYMAVEYKVDIIRDIFPLCRPCHNRYEKFSEEKRNAMAEAMGVQINCLHNGEMRKVRQAMGAASALLKHKAKMPDDRKVQLTRMVGEFLGKSEVTEDDLRAVRAYEIKDHDDYINFSKTVAQSVTDYNEFAKEWRLHFVETMNPQFMPTKWSVDRKTGVVWVPPRMLRQQSPDTLGSRRQSSGSRAS